MKKLKPIKPICVTVERTPVYEEKKLTITTETPDGTEKKEIQEVNVAPDKLLGYHLRRKIVCDFRKPKSGIVMPKKKRA